VGVAAAPASGTTSHEVPILPAHPNFVFEGNLDAGSGTTALSVASHMFTRFGLTLDATSDHWFVDSSDTTDERVVVVGFKDPNGTVNGRVFFVILPEATIYTSVATN
jgi:hypothetical protein